MADVEALGQAKEVAKIREVARAAAAVEIADIGCAADDGEGDGVSADFDVAFGIAGMQRETGRQAGYQVFDQARLETHSRALALDCGAGLAPHLASLGQQEIDADLLQHLQRGGVNGLDLVGRKDLLGTIGVARLAPGRLHRCPALTSAGPAPARLTLISPHDHTPRACNKRTIDREHVV